jgi:tRNA(Ile)-lysidine synthase
LSTGLPEGAACVAVACSGGRDSIALLHATARAACDVPGLTVVALHVHHGLSPQADAWAALVQATCSGWAADGWPVHAVVRQVACQLDGRGLEAAAREARYAALAEMAKDAGADMVLLAHHRRDQAETVLLQALRGGSVAGLSAMPSDVVRDGMRWVRPWLSHRRDAIEAYVEAHGLRFVDDDSNTDTRFARNRLRQVVWDPLTEAFPMAEQALADAARRQADAHAVLESAMAQQVLALCGGDPRLADLDVAAWARLDAPHRRLSLMHWYRQVAGTTLPASWVDRLSDELPLVLLRGKPASWPPVGLGLYRQRLSWVADMAGRVAQLRAAQPADDGPPQDWFAPTAAEVIWPVGQGGEPASEVVSFADTDVCRLPGWGGLLRLLPVLEGGVPRALLSTLTLRHRHGGEQFQLGPKRPARILRKQYQERKVPAWCRDGPLAWAGDRLVFVPGLGMDARAWATPGEPQWALVWAPDGDTETAASHPPIDPPLS